MNYYYQKENSNEGPVSAEELKDLFEKGIIKNDTPVIEEGGTSWSHYEKILGESCKTNLPIHNQTTIPVNHHEGENLSRKREGGFLNFIFVFGKIVSLIVLGGALILCLLASLNLCIGVGINTPDFHDYQLSLDQKILSAQKENNNLQINDNELKKLQVETEKKLVSILKEYEISKIAKNLSSQITGSLDKKYISSWIDGLERYLENAEVYYKNNQSNLEKIDITKENYFLSCVAQYLEDFDFAKRKFDSTKELSSYANWGMFAACWLFLTLTFFLPVLLKIESNTRS